MGRPVYRPHGDPADRGKPFRKLDGGFDGDLLYDRQEADASGEVRNLVGNGADKDMADLLVEALRSIDAPEEQLVRLGLG